MYHFSYLNCSLAQRGSDRNKDTVVPLLRDHPVVHTKVVFEEGWSFIRGRKQCKPKQVSSGIVVLNARWSLIRGVSQEGDYCTIYLNHDNLNPQNEALYGFSLHFL